MEKKVIRTRGKYWQDKHRGKKRTRIKKRQNFGGENKKRRGKT